MVSTRTGSISTLSAMCSRVKCAALSTALVSDFIAAAPGVGRPVALAIIGHVFLIVQSVTDAQRVWRPDELV